jgi:hypothetical protein
MLIVSPKSWTVFVQSQIAIVSSTQFIIDLEATLKSKSDTSVIWERMLALDSVLEPLVINADSWSPPVLASSPVDPSEASVAQALRCIAKIKLNR